MKKMIYQAKNKREILSTGYCSGLLFFILNLGTYPVAYIKVPKKSKYYGKDIGEVDLNVHGGVTYAKNYLYVSESEKINGWFIGWDYAHYGDYAGYEEKLPQELRVGGKKWTTEEIYREVQEACYQIVKLTFEKENNNFKNHINNKLKKEINLTIKNEDYLIQYSNSTDVVILFAYFNKLILEEDKIDVTGFEHNFYIINKTRYAQKLLKKE